MTIEELEIIVTAKVEEALKDFKKVAPTVRKMVQDTQNVMQKMDTNVIKNKVSRAVQEIKNKISSLKKSNKDNNIKLIVNNEEAKKQVTQLEKKIESLQKKITSREMQLQITNNAIDKTKYEARSQIQSQNPNLSASQVNNRADLKLDGDGGYNALIKQSDRLNTEVIKYTMLLDSAKNELASLKEEVGQAATSQSKLASFFSLFKNKLDQAKISAKGLGASFKKLPNLSQSVSNSIKKWGSNIKNGAKSIAKTGLALLSLRSVYNILSNFASSWLSSQNVGAQQLSANIEYMKYAMGSALAPVIQYVTNLVYQLLKAVQSLVYAFSGVNIFAKATASSMKSASSSANKANKSLAGVHSEINNVSENNSGGSGNVTPNIDMTSIDSNMTNFIQRIKNELVQLFQPIKDSWSIYGQPLIESAKNAFDGVKSLVESIGQSLQEVWLNGTGTETINLLLQGLTSIFNIIGNIGQAFTNAWNNENIGTSIVQSLWNGFNDLYSIIIDVYQTFEEWTASESFQIFANSIMGICKTLSGWFEKIAGKLKDIWENGGKETFTKLLEFISKVAELINVLLQTLTPVVDFILAIVTPVIEGIIEWLSYVIEALSGVLDFIIGVFTGDWNRAWQGIKDYFSSIWNAVKTIVETAIDFVKTYIESGISLIRDVWGSIWYEIENIVSNVWNGIWSCIKGVINSILGGIESFVNGTIRGINKLLSGISKVANVVGTLIGLNPISLQLSTISLPRLAKGNVAYSETVAVFGEYSGARNNPEITAPQNVLRETFSDVLAEHEYGKSQDTGMFKQLIIQFGSMQVAAEIDKLIQQARRQNGTAKITC